MAPAAFVLLRNDSLEAIMELRRESGAAGVAGLRLLRFGVDGHVNGVSIIDVSTDSRPAATLGLDMSSGPDGLLTRLAVSCIDALGALLPAPLYGQEEECVDAELDLMFAMSAWVAAEVAAYTACVPWVVPAPIACVGALGLLSVAAAYLTWKTTQYESCIMGSEPPSTSSAPEMRAADYQPTETGPCFYIDWEISYDGGETWHFYERQIVC